MTTAICAAFGYNCILCQSFKMIASHRIDTGPMTFKCQSFKKVASHRMDTGPMTFYVSHSIWLHFTEGIIKQCHLEYTCNISHYLVFDKET